jgi:hypothetical protein
MAKVPFVYFNMQYYYSRKQANSQHPQEKSRKRRCITVPNKYIHFTEAQKQAAKQTDLAAFLRSRNEKLKRSGSEHEWVGHHITLRGNMFYDQYAQKGGTAVDFAQEQYGLSYPEAIQLLLGDSSAMAPVTEYRQKDREPFELPPKNGNMRRVYAYLIGQRCISRDVLYHFARRGLIYEDAKYHNSVFVETDKDGIPRHAHKKSTSLNDSSFRINQAGSEAAFSFHHVGRSDTVYTFEAPIDMLSFISLHPNGWQRDSYVALCLVADHALFRLLMDNTHIRKVALCLDNDGAGREAMERTMAKLRERGYDDVSVLLSQNKDWGEDVKAQNGMAVIPAEPEESKITETEEDKCQELQFS